MKVIVNFDSVRVIVPCVDEMLVKDLILEATNRYKKATSKPSDSLVVIHNLKTCIDGAILDPDDRLNDVADDREQIIASFEEGSSHNDTYLQENDNNNHDVASVASDSLGTDSPDVFVPENTYNAISSSNGRLSPFHNVSPDVNSNNLNVILQCNDVEVTEDEINTCVPVPLQVRRGSEPVLNRLSPVLNDPIDLSKRWSTAVAIETKGTRKGSADSLRGDSIVDHSDDESKSPVFVKTSSLSPKSIKEEGYASEEKSENTPSSATSSSTFSRFSRGSGRLSMINNNINVWVEAADRQLIKMKNENNQNNSDVSNLNCDHQRRDEAVAKSLHCHSRNCDTSETGAQHPVIFRLKSESGPLGIHVVPFCDDNGDENGLVIQSIEREGRVDRDGRLKVGDKIVEINGQTLVSVKFQEAQDIFKHALSTPEIVLKVYKNQNASDTVPPLVPPPKMSKRPPPPPVMPKPSVKQDELEIGMVEGEEREGHMAKIATLTPTKKLTSGYGFICQKSALNPIAASNTRKIGRKYHVRLTKNTDGLGFSITTRDNPAGGNCPIYIKTILPKGAAIFDGRLKPGDRLLEVNGIEMTDKSHMEAVTVLRNIPLGCSVDLIVSRQEPDPSPSPKLPRQLPPENTVDAQTGRQREVLTFEIPLNDTGSAGLGVSVKGKTCAAPQGNSVDLGIFVKSVIHGGAASKDGRLQPNDQLISINGIPLLGIPNGDAMELLRRAMTQCEGPHANPNAITLTVARRVTSSRNDVLNESCYHPRNGSVISTDSCGDEQVLLPSSNVPNGDVLNDTESSYKSEATVIHNPKELNPTSPKSLESHLCHKHPVSDRLAGRDSSPSNYSVVNNESETKSKSNRIDVIIEGDQENSDSNASLQQTTPKSMPRTEEVFESEENVSVVKEIRSNADEDAGFQRDGFGRQSISEKRHAQLDAKNTDTYKRNKKAKEEKDKSKHLSEGDHCNGQAKNRNAECSQQSQPHDTGSCQSPGSCPYHTIPPQPSKKKPNVGPNLGMRKSSSLESLQTMMQELQREQLESRGGNPFAGPRPATLKVSRSRGTNESFRAAVDKSYDAPGNLPEAMETVAEEGSDSGSSINPIAIQPPNANHPIPSHPSGALSVASTHFTAVSSATTTASSQVTEDDKKQIIKKKNSSKKKGLFKTLFKFGSKKAKDPHKVHVKEIEDNDKSKARKAAQLEQERIHEHYKRLMEQQNRQKEAYTLQNQFQSDSSLIPSQPSHSTPTHAPEAESTQLTVLANYERMKHLRNQHQRHHTERHGNYPKDDRENLYDRELRDIVERQQVGNENRPLPPLPHLYSCPPNANLQRKRVVISKILNPHEMYVSNEPLRRAFSLRCANNLKRQETEVNHSRTNSYEICKEAMERPGSRVGIAGLNNKYSHYMNYREIQEHLEQFGPAHRSARPQALETVDRLKAVPQPQVVAVPLVPGRRKTERPISSYEFRNSGAIQNIAVYEQQLERQQSQPATHVQYGVIRNGMSCSSFPRRPLVNKVKHLNEAPVPIPQQAIYESRHSNVYSGNASNGVNYRPAVQGSYQRMAPNPPSRHMAQYYHSSRYQRESNQSQPASNV